MSIKNFFMGKTDDGDSKLIMIHFEGLPNFHEKLACNMILDKSVNALVFKSRVNKNAPAVTLPLEKILFAGNLMIDGTKKQSAVGRAFAGGLLFGGAGAVVGAMTAKEKKKLELYYIIRYKTENEEKEILLRENGNLNFRSFQKELKQLNPQIMQNKKELENAKEDITL